MRGLPPDRRIRLFLPAAVPEAGGASGPGGTAISGGGADAGIGGSDDPECLCGTGTAVCAAGLYGL